MIAISVTIFLGGCGRPTMTTPIGSPWAPNDVGELQGLWIAENGDYVQVAHYAGTLYVPNQGFNTNSLAFEVRTIEVTPRMLENKRLLFFKGKGESDPYAFVLIETERDGSISLRLPSPAFFSVAVKTSKLRGKLIQSRFFDDPSVVLEPDESGFQALLRTAKIEEMFPTKTKVSLRNVSRFAQHGGTEVGSAQEMTASENVEVEPQRSKQVYSVEKRCASTKSWRLGDNHGIQCDGPQ